MVKIFQIAAFLYFIGVLGAVIFSVLSFVGDNDDLPVHKIVFGIVKRAAFAAIWPLWVLAMCAISYKEEQQVEAEAKSMAIRAQALSQNKNLVEYEAVQKWNGKLPDYMLGNSVPFIQVAK